MLFLSERNIELSEDGRQEGIVLEPFQVVAVNRTVYARKISGTGTGVLAIIPHNKPPDSVFEDYTPPAKHHVHRCQPRDETDSYTIKIPRELIEQGQSKFIVEFPY